MRFSCSTHTTRTLVSIRNEAREGGRRYDVTISKLGAHVRLKRSSVSLDSSPQVGQITDPHLMI